MYRESDSDTDTSYSLAPSVSSYITHQNVKQSFEDKTIPRMAGYLSRRGKHLQKWVVRWFVLDVQYSSHLCYFIDNSERVKKGSYEINADSTIQFVPFKNGYKNVFQLKLDDRLFYANAPSKEGCDAWISVIGRVIELEKEKKAISLRSRAPPPIIPPNGRKTGYLSRRGQHLQKWEVRWFVLDSQVSSTLCYYADNSERIKKGSIKIEPESTVSFLPYKNGYKNVFELLTGDFRFLANCESKEDCDSWIAAIQQAIEKLKASANDEHEYQQQHRDDSRAVPRGVLRGITEAVVTSMSPSSLVGGLGFPVRPHDIYTAVRLAQRETQLTDLGFGEGATMLEGYDLVRRLGLVRSGLAYSSSGQEKILQGLENRVSERLRLVDYLSRHPRVQQQQIGKPIFIVGLPGSGASYLHELIALHPQIRFIRCWESLGSIVPLSDDETLQELKKDRQGRMEASKAKLMSMRTWPSVDRACEPHDPHDGVKRGAEARGLAGTPDADHPDDCTSMLALELPWSPFEAPLNTFTCSELAPRGTGPAFQLLESVLQLLQWQSLGRGKGGQREGEEPSSPTWALRCPLLLPHLDELRAVFPDSLIVWVHRDAVETVSATALGFEALLQSVSTQDSLSKPALGKAALQYTRHAVSQALRFLKAEQARSMSFTRSTTTSTIIDDAGGSTGGFGHVSSNKVLHLRYADCVREPAEMCRQVLEACGIAYSSSYDMLLDKHLDARARERRERRLLSKRATEEAEFDWDNYGLSAEHVTEALASYVTRFRLTPSMVRESFLPETMRESMRSALRGSLSHSSAHPMGAGSLSMTSRPSFASTGSDTSFAGVDVGAVGGRHSFGILGASVGGAAVGEGGVTSSTAAGGGIGGSIGGSASRRKSNKSSGQAGAGAHLATIMELDASSFSPPAIAASALDVHEEVGRAAGTSAWCENATMEIDVEHDWLTHRSQREVTDDSASIHSMQGSEVARGSYEPSVAAATAPTSVTVSTSKGSRRVGARDGAGVPAGPKHAMTMTQTTRALVSPIRQGRALPHPHSRSSTSTRTFGDDDGDDDDDSTSTAVRSVQSTQSAMGTNRGEWGLGPQMQTRARARGRPRSRKGRIQEVPPLSNQAVVFTGPTSRPSLSDALFGFHGHKCFLHSELPWSEGEGGQGGGRGGAEGEDQAFGTGGQHSYTSFYEVSKYSSLKDMKGGSS